MESPANSPDMNMFKHVWDMMGKTVQTHLPPVKTPQDLCQALTEKWNNIPLQFLRDLVASYILLLLKLIVAGTNIVSDSRG